MTRGQRERHKMTCRRLILAVLVVIVAIIATAAVKGNTGQQEGQERAEIIETGGGIRNQQGSTDGQIRRL